ncbi:MAG: nucleoside deaminase [Patescibacteria group bacterium]|nr:nucleoside deaminase [Patescibacteria group bacterium]
MTDEVFMREALEEAAISQQSGDWPIGCVIELDGKIIAKTHNQVYSTTDKLAHAEMLALRQVQGILKDHKGEATLYTTYEPCPMCFGAAILSRIKRVICGIDLDNSGAMHFRDNLPLLFKQDKFAVEFTTGVLADDCYEIFIKGEPTKKLLENGLIRKKSDLERMDI